MSRIDLVWMGGVEPPGWDLGRVLRAEPRPASLAALISEELPRSSAEAWLFWAGRLGKPDPERVERALSGPGDLWHAGLRLGMSGLPESIDSVAPSWMLNRDPDPAIEATSWRLSLDACLVRTEVLRRLGGVFPAFSTLAGAGLELGHRYISRGAMMRHVPWLAPETGQSESPALSLDDEYRLIHYRFGRLWLRWSLFRSALTGRISLRAARTLFTRLAKERRPEPPPPLREPSSVASAPPAAREAVTVLIPTVDRYPYLRKLLEGLRRQTIAPLEVLVVDQTPRQRREEKLATEFPDLSIRVLHLDRAGQCSSRNFGIEASRGHFLLFLDDDDEVPPDLIEQHLASLERNRNDVSSGVAEEDGAGPLPDAFRILRVSDVFPTNNSLIVKSVLARSGLFDLAYDRGARADADLGMRLYLSGSLMILDPAIRVIHRHAPTGGLRSHGARVITYASSRTRLMHRHVPSVTEIYLARRYFAPRQVREMLWLAVFGTFSSRGGPSRRLFKIAIGVAFLPDTLWKLHTRGRRALAMLETYPQIDRLPLAEAAVSRAIR